MNSLTVRSTTFEWGKQTYLMGIINDVSGGRMEPDILTVAAEHNVPIVLMHNRSELKNAQQKEALGERLEGTTAAVALYITQGADMVRVHDVRAMQRVAMLADAVVRG